MGIKGYKLAEYPLCKVPNVRPKFGAFAKVYAAQLNVNRDPSLTNPATNYALKEILITNQQRLEMTAREIRILKNLKHKNIAVLAEAFFDVSDPRIIYLGILPWAPETLHKCFTSLIQETKSAWDELSIGSWATIIVQCLEGLSYLHGNGVKHKDIKPHNILLQRIKNVDGNEEIQPIITDFNISKHDYKDADLSSASGTYEFKAPEQFLASVPKTFLSDIWSLGCCFAFIFIFVHSGKEELASFWNKVIVSEAPGFRNPRNLDALRRIIGTDCDKTRGLITIAFTRGLSMLLTSMLQDDYENREPAISAALNMRKWERYLFALKLGFPKMSASYTIKGRTSWTTIDPVRLLDFKRLIEDCEDELQKERDRRSHFWTRVLRLTDIVLCVEAHRSSPNAQDGRTEKVTTIGNFSKVWGPISDQIREPWSTDFYQVLRDFGETHHYEEQDSMQFVLHFFECVSRQMRIYRLVGGLTSEILRVVLWVKIIIDIFHHRVDINLVLLLLELC
ncbi:kinase-like domain-containing protein [Nemania sp. FL0916]|nr:kinase-like domain-containing protein [Nemania sp. FL0916]